jgi:hypothetical protein
MTKTTATKRGYYMMMMMMMMMMSMTLTMIMTMIMTNKNCRVSRAIITNDDGGDATNGLFHYSYSSRV